MPLHGKTKKEVKKEHRFEDQTFLHAIQVFAIGIWDMGELVMQIN